MSHLFQPRNIGQEQRVHTGWLESVSELSADQTVLSMGILDELPCRPQPRAARTRRPRARPASPSKGSFLLPTRRLCAEVGTDLGPYEERTQSDASAQTREAVGAPVGLSRWRCRRRPERRPATARATARLSILLLVRGGSPRRRHGWRGKLTPSARQPCCQGIRAVGSAELPVLVGRRRGSTPTLPPGNFGGLPTTFSGRKSRLMSPFVTRRRFGVRPS